MTFQKTVRYDQAFGVIGEIRFDGPLRAGSYILATPGADAVVLAANVVGHAFTFVADKPGLVQAGGTGAFAGIMGNPKVYPYWGGFAGSDTTPQALFVPNGIAAEFVTMGFIVAKVDKAAKPEDLIAYKQTDGSLTVVAAPAAGAEPTVPDGYTLVPNAHVDRYPQTNADGGLVLVRLTN